MKRVAWLTDIHLNFLNLPDLPLFFETIRASNPDVVLIGGDIGEANTWEFYLEMMARALQLPIYFVLGNHDYYGSSIRSVREHAAALCRESAHLHWLPGSGVVELSEQAALIGHDGWADGRVGDYLRSPILLNDYLLIRELTLPDPEARLAQLHLLGDEAADYLRRALPLALKEHRRVYLLTHVPPFREACWHEGQISNDDYLPHYTCKAVGDVLLEMMLRYPDRELIVLCGHSHGAGIARPAANIQVITGGAEYGHPVVNQVFEVE